jgi:hypothetical protein
MARGWESKSIESQIESAESRKQSPKPKDPSPEELAAMREREGLELSRVRVLHEMETCGNPRYRLILDKALADLDTRLAKFSLRRAAAHGG